MSLLAALVEGIFNLLNGKSEPATRWSIVIEGHPQHGKEPDVPGNDPDDSKQCLCGSKELVATTHRRDTVVDDTLPNQQSFERVHCGPATHSPDHSGKRTESCSSIVASHSCSRELTFYTKFHQLWRREEVIGEGGDGTVRLYQRSEEQGMYVAVKTPRGSSRCQDVEKEIMNMRLIGKHEHILELCYASKDWHPFGPAMFIPYCELGCLGDYRQLWCEQQALEGRPKRVSEITMCKLFRDMVLALNYIHSELGISYVHNDFKPGNILAVLPPDQTQYQEVPEEPIFKLADFARLTPWPTPRGMAPQKYDGTPEYAPPRFEQRAPVHPSADIWGLGATLQYMALGIQPVQSKEAFIRSCQVQGKFHPGLEDNFEWTSEYWRTRRPTVFRPLNVALKVLQNDFDLVHDLPDYQPYGARLAYWYAQLWLPIPSRPRASKLVAQAIPHMDDMVERLKLARLGRMDHYEELRAVCGMH